MSVVPATVRKLGFDVERVLQTANRVGFTYVETPTIGGFLGDVVNSIEFRPDPGVYDELTIDQKTITRGGISGAFGAIASKLGGVLMNPSEYTLTTKDGLSYRYHEDEGLQTITDLNGNVVTFTEDGISHSSGVSIDFVHDAQGRIDLITVPTIDNDGNPDTAVIDYEYDATTGDLVGFTNQADELTTYTYYSNPAHFLDEALDQNGEREFKVIYGDDGRFEQVIDVNGMIIQTADPPNLAQRTAVVRDGNGNATTLIFDDRGNVVEERDAFYDGPSTSGADCSQGVSVPHVTLRCYEDSRNPDLETEIIDRRGFVTQRDYDARGNLTEIREVGHQDSPFAEPVTTKFTYDTGNRVKSITNARQQTTWFEYDGKGNLTKIINAKGDFSTFTYDSKGRRETFTDFNGNTTTFAYASGDQPTRVTFADGTYQTFAYNQYGQVTSEQFFEANGTLVEQKSTFYDKLGRVTHEFDGETTDGVPNQVRSFYDADGNLDWQIIVNPASLDASGSLTDLLAVLLEKRESRITDFDYDDRDNLIRQTDAEGGVVEFRYDNNGNRVLLQDPVGNITTWVYDALNRVSEERDPFYNEAFTIDQAVADLSQASGASCETNTRAIHVTLSCYDGEDNLTKEIDRNGRRREFDYDSAGRLLTEDWFNADNSHERTLTFTYDVVGNMLTSNDPDSSLTFVYDVLNRLESVDNAGTPGAPNVILTYAYDKQGNVTLTQDNSGVTVESEYDERNRLAVRKWFDADVPAGETADVDPARVDMLYNAAGRMTEMSRWSDLDKTQFVGKTARTYELSGRSDLLTHTDAIDDLIASYDYDYDFAGLLDVETREHQDTQFSQSIDYDYDLTGQLTDVDYSKQADEFYRYDFNGNRTRSHLHGTDYVTGTANQLESDGDFDYEYDGEGNLILKTKLNTDVNGAEGEVTTYEYDHRNRLVNVARKSAGGLIISEVSYTYDALNRRIARTANGETIHFVYSGDNVWADFNQVGEAVARYLFGNRIDQNIARLRTGEGMAWYLSDRLGTIRDIALAGGGGEYHAEFGSFGHRVQSHSAVADRFGFQGRELDSAADGYYFRARFVTSSTGRFNSNDPLSFGSGEQNLYRLLSNSPVNGVDPTGLVVLSETLIHASAILAAAGPFVGAFAADLTLDLCETQFTHRFSNEFRALALVTGTVVGFSVSFGTVLAALGALPASVVPTVFGDN